MNKKMNLPILLLSLSPGFISFILPVYAKEIHMSTLEIGGLFSIVSFANLITRPFIGKAMDHYGRKSFFLIASIFISVALFCYAFSDLGYLLFIARTIHAVGASILGMTIYSISIDLSKKDNVGHRIGIFDAAKSRGALYGTTIGFIVLMQTSFILGWKITFVLFAVCGIIASFYIFKYIPETKRKDVTEEKTKIKMTKLIATLGIIVFFSSITSGMITPIFMVYLQDNVVKDVGFLALAFIPASIIHSTFPNQAGRYVDHLGRKKTLILGKIIALIGIIIFTQVTNIWILTALWAIEALGIILTSIAYRSLIADLTGRKRVAEVFGFFMVLISLGGMIGPLMGGYLYDINIYYPFYLNALIKFIDILIIITFIPKTLRTLHY